MSIINEIKLEINPVWQGWLSFMCFGIQSKKPESLVAPSVVMSVQSNFHEAADGNSNRNSLVEGGAMSS